MKTSIPIILRLLLGGLFVLKLSPKPLQAQTQLFSSEKETFTTRILSRTLDHPWSMLELPDHSFLITERSGELLHFLPGSKSFIPIKGLPHILSKGHAGLLDIVASPDMNTSGFFYFSYTRVDLVKGMSVVVAKAKLNNDALADLTEIYATPPVPPSSLNIGGRMFIGPDQALYLGVGDFFNQPYGQDLSKAQAKVLRLTLDGQPFPSNSFVQPNALKEIFTLGNRNAEGLYYDASTAIFWECEQGPMGGDEINILQNAENYGWAVVSQGINYDGTPVGSGKFSQSGMVDPMWVWTPSIAPSSLMIYKGNAFANWQGNMFVTALKFQYLARLTLKGNKVVSEEKLLKDQFGRLRQAYVASDGRIYLLTDSDQGYLVVLEPPEAPAKVVSPLESTKP